MFNVDCNLYLRATILDTFQTVIDTFQTMQTVLDTFQTVLNTFQTVLVIINMKTRKPIECRQ